VCDGIRGVVSRLIVRDFGRCTVAERCGGGEEIGGQVAPDLPGPAVLGRDALAGGLAPQLGESAT